MYLLPQTHLSGRQRRGLGAVAIAPTVSDIVRVPVTRILPAPVRVSPRAPILIARENPPGVTLPPTPVENPITAPIANTGANYAGTPVPIGFPTNQFFVANDGSLWQYSAAQNTWLNQGAPYNVGASAVSAPAVTPAQDTSLPTSVAPASTTTTVVAPATDSYQSILDWLSESTLISSVPNWVMVAGIGLLALKLTRSNQGRR